MEERDEMKLTVFKFFLAVSLLSISKRSSARNVPRTVISSTLRTGINATIKSFKNSILYFYIFFLVYHKKYNPVT